jgi:hypothetical protein
VCFYGGGTKLIIPWVEVSSLARTAAGNSSAIYLATGGNEVMREWSAICAVALSTQARLSLTCVLFDTVHICSQGSRSHADDDEGDLAHDVGQHGAQGDGRL